jgi:hypothetical protein
MAALPVTQYRYKFAWRTPKKPITIRGAIDAFVGMGSKT